VMVDGAAPPAQLRCLHRVRELLEARDT
jgi:hypothetical protein